jgi:hypothetical protein
VTRKSIVIVSVLYVVAALTFGAVIELTNPFRFNGSPALVALIGRIAGGGVAAYVVPGLLLMIAWGTMRFRMEKAAGPVRDRCFDSPWFVSQSAPLLRPLVLAGR